MSDVTRHKLQEALDAHLVDEFGDFAIAKDWVLSSHVVSLEDVNEDSARISIIKGAQTSVFTALGILMIANDTYRYQMDNAEEEDE